MQNNRIKYIIGIDESGRGPLAGPLTVAACRLPVRYMTLFSSVGILLRDSKLLSERQRDEWYKCLSELKQKGKIDFAITHISPSKLDKDRMTKCLRVAINRILSKLIASPDEVRVLLDGGLKAPKQYIYQETIIKGDEREPAVALASILAKVTRDRKMMQLAKKFPEYGFDFHKGYGTKSHFKAIKKHGSCFCHRQSFLT